MKVYHGTEKEFKTFAIPSFFSNDEYIAADYGDVTEYELEIKNPCKLSDVIATAAKLELNHEDIKAYRTANDMHGRHIEYAEDNDYLYLPIVIEFLKAQGFDGFADHPLCDNEVLVDEIEVVPFFEVTAL